MDLQTRPEPDRSGHWQLALHTLDLLRAARFQPDMVSYGSVMNSLAGGGMALMALAASFYLYSMFYVSSSYVLFACPSVYLSLSIHLLMGK